MKYEASPRVMGLVFVDGDATIGGGAFSSVEAEARDGAAAGGDAATRSVGSTAMDGGRMSAVVGVLGVLGVLGMPAAMASASPGVRDRGDGCAIGVEVERVASNRSRQ